MNNLKIFGKYLDQPNLIKKVEKNMPVLLVSGGSIYITNECLKTPKEERKNKFKQQGVTMLGVVLSSLLAPKITNKIFKNANVINDTFINKNINLLMNKKNIDEHTKQILLKSKDKILSFNEIKYLFKNIKDIEAKNILNNVIQAPVETSSKEIFSEIGRLSLFGAIPVIGGVASGIIGDKIIDKNYKEKIPNKIKEGIYQYLANIFLCNIGAGLSLMTLEKLNIKSKSMRVIGMITGIAITGVIFGSKIANYIGDNIINKYIFKTKNHEKRKPEPLDICLHTDDIATVAVMSGLKWIEPTLPMLYSISGYRAGIGYRGKGHKNEVLNNIDSENYTSNMNC